MKRSNLLYLAIIPLCFLLYQMSKDLGKASAFFYGFAENKETELSHDKSVLIHKIYVTPGQEVVNGQLLMEVKQASIDFKIDNVSSDIERLETIARQNKQEIENKIAQLKVKKTTKISALQEEIRELESTIQYNNSLLEDLKSIDKTTISGRETPNTLRLKSLKDNILIVTKPMDIELAQLEKELLNVLKPSQVQKQKLQSQINYYKTEQNKLAIVAPSDGIIGNILCKEGENISAFSKLINFYEPMPTMVKGYVHESLILQVKVGDSLEVSSTLHPEQKKKGKIIGLGSRIVEIPERLRKNPDFKTYGREVLIKIPPNNPFLQKEKVMLNALNGNDSNSITSLFSPIDTKVNKKEEKRIMNTMSVKK